MGNIAYRRTFVPVGTYVCDQLLAMFRVGTYRIPFLEVLQAYGETYGYGFVFRAKMYVKKPVSEQVLDVSVATPADDNVFFVLAHCLATPFAT